MKVQPTFLLLASSAWLAVAQPSDADLAQQARIEARNLLTKARLEVMIEHYKQLNGELLKIELERDFARAESSLPGAPSPDEWRLTVLEARVDVLRRAIELRDQAITELMAKHVQAQHEAKSETDIVEWQGAGVGDAGLVMVLRLRGSEGKFVVEEGENRLAGTVNMDGKTCDFRVLEARGEGVQKYVGTTARGRWQQTDRGLAVVLNEPGRPERPAKLEAEGDFKAFLLQRR